MAYFIFVSKVKRESIIYFIIFLKYLPYSPVWKELRKYLVGRDH